jgi:hypothetical protein
VNTTSGEWIVEPNTTKAVEGVYLHRIMSIGPNGNTVIALVPNMADASLMCASQKILNALIVILEKLNHSKEPIDLEEINLLASAAIEKIASEAGEF